MILECKDNQCFEKIQRNNGANSEKIQRNNEANSEKIQRNAGWGMGELAEDGDKGAVFLRKKCHAYE